MKKHNGGAAVHNCIYYDSSSYLDKFGFTAQNQTSSIKLARSHFDASENKQYYESHATNDTLKDLYNSSMTYQVPKYATVIKNNNFTRNFAGM